jgi:hypothetical protein
VNIKILIGIALLSLLTGCVLFFPARIVMPLNTTVVDAETGNPVESAKVLRIVCDIHDRSCTHARMDWGQTDQNGVVKASGDRKWGLWVPAPGGLPVPNHQIAIWKEGYYAFVFSQYGNIDDIKERTSRPDIMDAISAIPKDRRQCDADDRPDEMFSGGEVKLYKLVK